MAVATKKVETPEQTIKRLQAQVLELQERNKAQAEGKDETGTYGWTNLPNDEADRLREEKAGRRFADQDERNASAVDFDARGGLAREAPVSRTVVRDAATGKVIEGPGDNVPQKDAAPILTGPVVDSPEERTII